MQFSDPNLNALLYLTLIAITIIITLRSLRKRWGGPSISTGGLAEPTSDVSMREIFTQRTPEGELFEPTGRIAGIGALIGIAAACVGLISVIPNPGMSLIPFPAMGIEAMQDMAYFTSATIFLGLLWLGLFVQWYWSKELRIRLGGLYTHLFGFAALIGIGTMAFWALNVSVPVYPQEIRDFMGGWVVWLGLFSVVWQLVPVIYVDSSKNWIGSATGILNALFLPLLAIGYALNASLIYLAYITLLLGQLLALLFWWSPIGSIREFARSSDSAKKTFGFIGLLTFLIGSVAVFMGPFSNLSGADVWFAFGVIDESTGMLHTNPLLVYAFCGMLIFWVMLGPRLGAKELKVAHIKDDIIKGGSKWGMVILASLGMFAAAGAGGDVLDPSGVSFFISVAAPATMFMMGAIYAGTTDVITGLPLIVAGLAMLVHPYSLGVLVLIPWILVLVTQALLMIETFVRGFTSYSQGALTVIISMVTSVMFLMFVLGAFGSGPAAMWPTNLWFPISMFGEELQYILGYTVVALPMIILLIRNVALAGYAHGRGYAGGEILMGLSMLFALIVPLIAGNVGIIHIASTGAALLMANYAISFVLVLSMNLNLAADIEETGHAFEGQIVRTSTIIGLIFGAVVAILVLGIFSGFPDASQVAFIISMLVVLITGLEILSVFTWLVAGVRLGMLKEGFSFTRA